MMKNTMAILGDPGELFSKVMKVFVKQDLKMLFVSEDEAKKDRVKKQVEHLLPEADIEFISCEREGCWEADMITIVWPNIFSSSLVEKIKEVATQKIVLVISENNKQPEKLYLEKLLPNSRVVQLDFDVQQKKVLSYGEDTVKGEVKNLFEDLGNQLKKK